MRLEYITPKKDYHLKSSILFEDEVFLKELKNIPSVFSTEQRNLKLISLLKKYHLDETYLDEVNDFVKNNGWRNADYALDKNGLVLMIPESKNPLDHYFLRVGSNTTLEEIKDTFNLVGKLKKVGGTKSRNRKKSKGGRDAVIFIMAKSNIPWQEIKETIHKRYGDKLYETNIRTIVTDVCKKLNIPKEERPKVYGRKSVVRIT